MKKIKWEKTKKILEKKGNDTASTDKKESENVNIENSKKKRLTINQCIRRKTAEKCGRAC